MNIKITHNVPLTHCYAIEVTYPDGHTNKLGVRFFTEGQANHYIRALPTNGYTYNVVKEVH